MKSATRVSLSLLLFGLLAVPAHFAGAQWSVRPTAGVGAAVPGPALHDVVAEGATAKVGVWMRAPRVPVGLTAEAMYTHLRGGRTVPRSGSLPVASLSANVTTRRHEGRLDFYGTLGAGWYWHGDPDDRFLDGSAPGFNVGIGEVVAVNGRDVFVELRLHAIRTSNEGGPAWTTFMPLMLGVRF